MKYLFLLSFICVILSTNTELQVYGNQSMCQVIRPNEGEIVKCQNPQKPNIRIPCTEIESIEYTIAIFSCDKYWTAGNSSITSIKQVCLNKNWVKEHGDFSCKPKCGFINNEEDIQPWIVDIMQRNRQDVKCQGALISNRAIITSAQCVTIKNSTVERRPEEFEVKFPAASVQSSFEKIVLHHEYNDTTLANDLAIIWLKRPIKLQSQILPICMPNMNEKNDEREREVEFVSSDNYLQFTRIGLHACRQKVSQYSNPLRLGNKHFCAQFHKRTRCTQNIPKLGSTYLIQDEKSREWSLAGIRTGHEIPQKIFNCDHPIVFISIPHYAVWFQRELARQPPIFFIDTVIYTTSTSTTTSKPIQREREPLTPELFLVNTFTRKPPIIDFETFQESTSSGKIRYNSKGTTISTTTTTSSPTKTYNRNPTPFYAVIPTRFPLSTAPTRKPKPTLNTTQKTSTTPINIVNIESNNRSNKTVTCEPIPLQNGVIQLCKHDEYEDFDDCSNGGQIGTVATLRCQDYYKPAYGPATLRRECTAEKRWNPSRSFVCQLECGISTRPRRSYIVNGILSDRLSWPWHATIYRKLGDTTRYICGGTLITKSFVVTAGHCVTIPGTRNLVDRDELRIVLASNSSNYTENLLDPISKANVYYVKSIWIPDSYSGITFDSDIAIIQLEFEVEFSDYVKPICFPFQSRENADIELLQLSPGTQGQTVGFGRDEYGELAHTIREASIPVVSHRDCGDVLARYPTSTQFCAGYLNGTAVCNGDSGSGLFFSEGTGYTNRYIIQGIVSFGDHTASRICNHETYAVFTKVSSFASWVQGLLETLEPDPQR